MKKLLRELNKKYDLKLGNKLFSPVMQCSIGLAMHYNKEVNNGLDVPFHLNFPDKHNAALWLSVALLRNFLLEDYINQPEDRIEELNINPGEKVEIFDAIAIFRGTKYDKLLLEFSRQNTPIEITNRLTKYLNKTNRTRVNRYSLFAKNKKEAKSNRNAISKLLEPDEPILINQEIIKSKVLVIAGRGNTGNFANRLKEEYLFETPLSEVFNSGENIIIKPDLEDFKFLTANDDLSKADYFERAFIKSKSELLKAAPKREEEINKLIESVEKSNYRNHKFLKLYKDILEDIDESEQKVVHRIFSLFPGLKDNLPENIQSVVINDIRQIEHYEGIIGQFLKRKIPVLILSNRFIEDKKALTFFDDYFSQKNNELRINWNKTKIKALNKTQTPYNPKFLDKELWQNCLKFSKQIISLFISQEHPSDSLFIDLQRNIAKLEGHERLKNIYWKVFNPLIYSFKNGYSWNEYHEILIKSFLKVFNEVKMTLDSRTRELFEDLLESMLQTKNNFKKISEYENIFVLPLEAGNDVYYFPELVNKKSTIKDIDSDTKQITFTGYPLNEPLNKYLLNSISEYLTPDIKLICWPKEGELTFNYIRRRLKAGYFLDKIHSDWGFDNNLLIKSEKDINNEIDSILFSDLTKKIVIDNSLGDEIILDNISAFKYSAYKSSRTGETSSIVNCNIIDLEGSSFMFLPKNSTVLAKIETEGNEFDFKRAKFKELNIGDEIFQYELPRHQLRELSKSVEGSDSVFNDLEIWRKSLHKTFENCNRNLKKLLKTLRHINQKYSIGGSPTYQNLRNWLYDEDMLSPEEKNLRMILLADSDNNKINTLEKILSAYETARSLSRKISSEIKKSIIKKLGKLEMENKQKFLVELYGITLLVEFRKIIGLQKTDIEVEYQNTRKIIQ